MQRRDVVVAGVRCSIATGGPAAQAEARDAVVFVHGNPGPSDDWAELAPKVAEFARTLTFDMPGYGRSERPRHFEYTVGGHARFLGELLDVLEIEGAHLVLHDFGGPWGLAWGAAHPARLRSVTLINTGVLIDYEWHGFARVWQTPLFGELYFAVMTPWLVHRGIEARNPRPFPRSHAERIVQYSDRGHRDAVLGLYRASRHQDAEMRRLADTLRARDTPALVLWGEGDAYVPVTQAESQRQAFPSAKIVRIERAGHWPMVDDPELVLSHMLPFLRAQTGADAPEDGP